jgi:hypothetical protein
MPTSSGRGIESGGAGAFENRADRLGIGKDVDSRPRPGYARPIGKTCIANPRGKALAQIDVGRDLAIAAATFS